jgi:hypothetical protein
LSPRACQIRCTVAALTPNPAAVVRQLQCVCPGGVVCSVAWTIASTISGGMDGLAPRPGRTRPNLFKPSSANRCRQDLTDVADTPNSAAIRSLATPSAASNNARARSTSRCGAEDDRDRVSSIAR